MPAPTGNPKLHEAIAAGLRDTARLLAELPAEQIARVAEAGRAMAGALKAGRKIIWFGNGGSAT